MGKLPSPRNADADGSKSRQPLVAIHRPLASNHEPRVSPSGRQRLKTCAVRQYGSGRNPAAQKPYTSVTREIVLVFSIPGGGLLSTLMLNEARAEKLPNIFVVSAVVEK